MPITRTPQIDDDLTGTIGTVWNNAWKQELYDQIDALAVGGNSPWVDVPFSAANYTASTGTWTVTAGVQTTLAYLVVGPAVFAMVMIGGAQTLSAATTYLRITVPGMPPASRSAAGAFTYFVAGAVGTGNINIVGNRFDIIRDIAGTQWPAGTGISMFLQAELYWSK